VFFPSSYSLRRALRPLPISTPPCSFPPSLLHSAPPSSHTLVPS
jgi:hypothetical protein